jgi:hypothetical protein
MHARHYPLVVRSSSFRCEEVVRTGGKCHSKSQRFLEGGPGTGRGPASA